MNLSLKLKHGEKVVIRSLSSPDAPKNFDKAVTEITAYSGIRPILNNGPVSLYQVNKEAKAKGFTEADVEKALLLLSSNHKLDYKEGYGLNMMVYFDEGEC